MEHDSSKKDLIIEAAYEVFKRFGYEKTAMNDIARAAKMGKGSVYYYFESKEDIFIAALEQEVQNGLNKIVSSLNRINDPIERLKHALIKPLSIISEAPLLMQVWNDENHFLRKLKEFKKEKHCKLKELLRSCVVYAQERGVLIEEFDVETFLEFIVKWFYMGDDEVTFELTPQVVEGILKDFELMTDYMLYGILKRS